jgi:hypothetical protein
MLAAPLLMRRPDTISAVRTDSADIVAIILSPPLESDSRLSPVPKGVNRLISNMGLRFGQRGDAASVGALDIDGSPSPVLL